MSTKIKYISINSFSNSNYFNQGAGDPEVRLRLSAAAAALLGLGADQITVVKR